MQVNMLEAKTNLSKLAAMVAEGGERVVIAKAGKPLVDLVPHQESGPRIPGGYTVVMDRFDEADDEITTLFAGSE
ncbi:MAG: antitoxin (DNA-binding transcriptional repressor) of toxin-antitoxin stability system [Rhodothermales bacterium]|jgi:antitoxin (DNA-binding transcriptional repressor) of toxin-antitoxin stability system